RAELEQSSAKTIGVPAAGRVAASNCVGLYTTRTWEVFRLRHENYEAPIPPLSPQGRCLLYPRFTFRKTGEPGNAGPSRSDRAFQRPVASPPSGASESSTRDRKCVVRGAAYFERLAWISREKHSPK